MVPAARCAHSAHSPGHVGGVYGRHPHVGAQGRRQLLARRDGRFGGRECVENQQARGPPHRDVVRQARLEGRPVGQRRQVAHPDLGGRELLDVVEHALGDAERPAAWPAAVTGIRPMRVAGDVPRVRLAGEEREGPVLGTNTSSAL